MSKLAIIAGLGDLPLSIARAAQENGRDLHVFRLAGFEEKSLLEFPGETVGMGQLGRLVRRLKQERCDEVVFAGIVKRPNFADVKLDLRGARILPRVLKAAKQGDDALLRVLVTHLEKEGFRVVAAEDAAKELLAGGGVLFGEAPEETALDDMRKAAAIAAEIGRLDIGQGCVVVDGLVLAVEAQEGTDAMLTRVAGLDPALKGDRHARKGVLVKRPKPIQERRVDLPVIGPGTIKGVADAGLSGIGLEEGGALLLNRRKLEELCETLGVFVYGFPADWSSGT